MKLGRNDVRGGRLKGGLSGADLFRSHRIAKMRQVCNQRLDPGDRTEIRRPHVAFGNFEIELGFDGQHKINEIERGQSVLAEIVVAADQAVNRSLGEQRSHQSVNAFAHIGIAVFKHAESPRNPPPTEAGFFDAIISLTERDSGITILRGPGIRTVTLMEKNRANCI
jgi:hypothetical protein